MGTQDLIIYGASDDLIEVEGLVCDEFNQVDPATIVVVVDGELHARLHIGYGIESSDGWDIYGTQGPVEITKARGDGEPDDEHGCPGYSDKAVIRMGVDASRVQVFVEDTSFGEDE